MSDNERAAALTERERSDALPPLPEPEFLGWGQDRCHNDYRIEGYTAEQMREYALAALTPLAPPEPAARVTNVPFPYELHDKPRPNAVAGARVTKVSGAAPPEPPTELVALAQIAEIMREEHDKGDGHFSTDQVLLMEKLASRPSPKVHSSILSSAPSETYTASDGT